VLLLGRLRHRCDDNIKMDVKGMGLEGMDRNHLAEGRDNGWAVVITVMNLRVP
jgi:hypothetical protein